MYYIYCITNLPENRRYIGVTRSPRDRVRAHLQGNNELSSDIEILGRENFLYEVLETTSSPEAAGEKELHWVKLFGTLSPSRGYNIQNGGFSKYRNSLRKHTAGRFPTYGLLSELF
jgi:group I intron endonuclease